MLKTYPTYLLFFLLMHIAGFAHSLVLKDKLQEAKAGHYVVTQQGKTYALLSVRDKTETALVLEEIAVSASNFARNGLSWRAWLEQGAPGHTSWTISKITLLTGNFEKIFSYTHHSWADLTNVDPFLSTLLNLHFKEVPALQRKRIGLPPGYGKADSRPLWTPPIVIDGTARHDIPCRIYTASWPYDHSELAGRSIDIYLAETDAAPTFFPYWVEVEGKVGSAKMRIVDAGQDVYSPRSGFPQPE